MACCAAAMFILLNIVFAVQKFLLPIFGYGKSEEKPNSAVLWSPGQSEAALNTAGGPHRFFQPSYSAAFGVMKNIRARPVILASVTGMGVFVGIMSFAAVSGMALTPSNNDLLAALQKSICGRFSGTTSLKAADMLSQVTFK